MLRWDGLPAVGREAVRVGMDATPFLVSGFGVLLGALGGITVYQLGSIRACVSRLDDKFYKHLVDGNLHEAGMMRESSLLKVDLARLKSDADAAKQVAIVAHKRMDALVEKRGT